MTARTNHVAGREPWSFLLLLVNMVMWHVELLLFVKPLCWLHAPVLLMMAASDGCAAPPLTFWLSKRGPGPAAAAAPQSAVCTEPPGPVGWGLYVNMKHMGPEHVGTLLPHAQCCHGSQTAAARVEACRVTL